MAYGRDIAAMAGLPARSFGAAGRGARASLRDRLRNYMAQQAAQRQAAQMQGLAQLVSLATMMRSRRPQAQPTGGPGDFYDPDVADYARFAGAQAPPPEQPERYGPRGFGAPWWNLMPPTGPTGGY